MLTGLKLVDIMVGKTGGQDPSADPSPPFWSKVTEILAFKKLAGKGVHVEMNRKQFSGSM